MATRAVVYWCFVCAFSVVSGAPPSSPPRAAAKKMAEACAPEPVVSVFLEHDDLGMTTGGAPTVGVSFGTREQKDDAIDEDDGATRVGTNATCVRERSVTYVITTLPHRGVLLDVHTLARITTVPHILASGVGKRE